MFLHFTLKLRYERTHITLFSVCEKSGSRITFRNNPFKKKKYFNNFVGTVQTREISSCN